MAISYLTAVNETLKMAQVIKSATELTSFTSSGIQHDVDIIRRAWKMVLTALRREVGIVGETAQGTLTLQEGKISYFIASELVITNFVGVISDMVSVNHRRIREYDKGERGDPWLAMFEDFPDRSERTGYPSWYAVNTSGSTIELDTTPGAAEAGEAYTFIYDKLFGPTLTTDTFGFNDDAIEALYPAVVEVFNRYRKSSFSLEIYNASLADAADLNRGTPKARRYGPVIRTPLEI